MFKVVCFSIKVNLARRSILIKNNFIANFFIVIKLNDIAFNSRRCIFYIIFSNIGIT